MPTPPSTARIAALVLLALSGFAANSLLCRAALAAGGIDPASFTVVRIVSGALTLWLLVRLRDGAAAGAGSWPSALALFAYAAAFSFAYISLPTGTGALLLFGAVQLTMIGVGLLRGERLGALQWSGLLLAFGGLAWLLWPGVAAPSWIGSVLMLGAGVAWGLYSLRGRREGDPLQVTAGNFLRSVPLALLLCLPWLGALRADGFGMALAIASGALASGIGYALWYAALPALRATTAASLQLAVPVIAAIAGVLLLAEPLGARLVLSSLAVLGGIAMVIRRPLRGARG